ncbi:stabilization of polarity axis-domain-containing protein [Powellomyces hirtus]|nr:stabilization of polarity axis-domain-containing protein [Powellomyces hirtus]
MTVPSLFGAVDAVLVAEFDIDKGSALSFQYPVPTGTDVHVLSELMLPDGAHLREEDWTMFLLNQSDAAKEKAAIAERREEPSTYVLNLVRTKHISNVRRGARVKAMAVASRYQWVHVFKPLLVLALDKFFNDPTIGILEDLYNAINCMDMTRMPRLSLRQRNIFRDSEDNSVLDDKFKDDEAKVGLDPHTRMSIAASAAGADSVPASPVGATGAAKSLGNKDRHFFETTVRYGTIRMPVRIPLVLFPEEIGDVCAESGSGDNTALKWRNGVPYSWHPHLDIGPQTHPIIVLLNAILTEKRVLFLGDKRPSGEVADYVLATCALAGGGGLLRGFAERCFPYVSLAGVDGLLAVPGYIAGVTNPVFEEQQSWWDVLCNVGTGKISVSQKLVTSQASADRESSKDKEKEWFRTSGYELDHDFISDAMTAAQTHAGEFHIRQKFLHYVQRFVDVTAAFEQVTYKRSELAVQPTHVDQVDLGHGPFFLHERARTREMQIMRNRISGWRTTRSYQYFTQVRSEQSRFLHCVKLLMDLLAPGLSYFPPTTCDTKP